MKDETSVNRDAVSAAAAPAMTKLCQPRLKPQYLVLLMLREKYGLTVSGLGARVRLDSGTLSQLLKRLEKPALSAGSATRNRMSDACWFF